MPDEPGLRLPFRDSRRLTGPNLYFAQCGAVLEASPASVALIADWRMRVARAIARLGWPAPAGQSSQVIARPNSQGAELALAAPPDQLYTATEINEWAWCSAVHASAPGRWPSLERDWLAAALEDAPDPDAIVAPVLDEDAAFARLSMLSAREAQPRLVALIEAAARRGVPVTLDDDWLTLGRGARGRSWPAAAPPLQAEVEWHSLGDIPVALVTGSNGKTTTVRLVAACLAATGRRVGYTCTDGIYVAGIEVATGDYSGPHGARSVLRDRSVEAAVLETARGGILRRGLAAHPVHCAIVTNLSADHFGEYGIDDLAALADVKFTVASALEPEGLLVLNSDQPESAAALARLKASRAIGPRIAWFGGAVLDGPSLDPSTPVCGLRDDLLCLRWQGREHELGTLDTLPLAAGGQAGYNVANLAGAALVAAQLGVSPALIARVFQDFGRRPEDNAGRLMRFDREGVTVLIDYAHNPEGLSGVLRVASAGRGSASRLGLTLGHAGNRLDADLERFAHAAAAFAPDLVVVKENEAHLRGRAPGEVPALLRAGLLAAGLAPAAIDQAGSELEAATRLLAWARRGDVVVLLLHARAAREAALELLRGTGAGATAPPAALSGD